MNTEHDVTVDKVKTTFNLVQMPEAARNEYKNSLRLAKTAEDREAWFADLFYWLYDGHKTEGKKAQERAGVILAMNSPEYASLAARVTKDQKAMEDFFEKISADEPEQKPAEETA